MWASFSWTESEVWSRSVGMYIAVVPNRSSPPAILLREGYREGRTVKNRTLANLSKWPPQKIDLLRRVLRDETLAPADALFEVVASTHHGHVQAGRLAMQRLGFDALIASRPSRERGLRGPMVVARILEPDSKLATTRWGHTTPPPADPGGGDADEGDRGMISQTQITVLKTLEGTDWITALKTEALRDLVATGHVQLGLFDERNLFELTHPDFPGERLVACRNPELAALRAHKRQALLAATAKELEKVRGMVARGRLRGRDAIGVRVGKVVNKYRVAKHFRLEIQDDRFAFEIDAARVAAEAALDGLYVIRTSLPAERLAAADTVRAYKRLSDVERAFRSLKTIDLKVRPIRHRLQARGRAPLFLCLLAYYVQRHSRESLRPPLFSAEGSAGQAPLRPVGPA